MMYYQKRVNLIKRPPLIRSSTSTFTKSADSIKPKKSVRFCDSGSLENVRLFLKTQMPKACQSDPPLQPTFSLHRTNWPSKTSNHHVQLQQIELKQGQNNRVRLDGLVRAANLAFEKHVVVHYTLDNWTTVQTTDCSFQRSTGTWDIFKFDIQLHHPAHQQLSLAVKYRVNGHEFWDNNSNKNYEFDIVPDVLQDESSSSSSDSDDEHVFENIFAQSPCQQKPLSPPLSPTTPIDANPIWSDRSYFDSKNTNQFDTIHEFIQKYYQPSPHMLTSTYYSNRSQPASPKAVLG
ncbi:putative phosphatase regulatory subunit-domain-containing protein [Blakeslea trispora]|nr:putative phosphatase regulatory subunit-domain-containing protein [Blakeslea trispora]